MGDGSLGTRRGTLRHAEHVGVVGDYVRPVVPVSEPDDHVTQVLHRLLLGGVPRPALRVVVVRTVHVNRRAVLAVEEVGAGSGLLEEALGVGR